MPVEITKGKLTVVLGDGFHRSGDLQRVLAVKNVVVEAVFVRGDDAALVLPHGRENLNMGEDGISSFAARSPQGRVLQVFKYKKK